MSRVPIVIVFGATGTGKSSLAIKLAKKFNGEIISADSIQVYKGLDIASNKITQAERAEVRHHMLDILRPMDRYSVADYRNQVLPIIDDILERKKLPIVVGGTNYYIEAILWKMLVESEYSENKELIFNRYQVLKDRNFINKWRTYKASVLPLREEVQETEIVDRGHEKKTDSDKREVSKEDLNLLIEQIKSINCDFINVTKNIQNTLNVAFKYYKRTLYPMNASRDQKQINSKHDEDEIVDIVDLENKLMNDYICRNVEEAMEYMSRRNNLEVVESDSDAEVWKPIPADIDLKSSYCILAEKLRLPYFSEFDFLNCSDFWSSNTLERLFGGSSRSISECVNRFVEFYDNHRCLSFQCFYVFKKLVRIIKAISTVRIKRLTLIRIIDDEIMLDFDNDELYAELRLVDPEMIKEMHWNNRRKVIRSLQVFFQTGEMMSEIQNKMRGLEGGCSISGPLRFPDACLLWLHSDQEVLNIRLKERVEQMMDTGLIAELLEFHKQYNIQRLAHNLKADYSKGIFQSIGFKEFHSYLMLSEEERDTRKGRKLLEHGIEALKLATIKYSKYQTRYMMNKFVKIPDTKQVPPLFKLDATELEAWQENVEKIAYYIVDNYLKGADMRNLEYSTISIQEPDQTRFQRGEFYCDICDRTFIGNYQWQLHYRSKKHRKVLYKKKVKELQRKIAKLNMSAVE